MGNAFRVRRLAERPSSAALQAPLVSTFAALRSLTPHGSPFVLQQAAHTVLPGTPETQRITPAHGSHMMREILVASVDALGACSRRARRPPSLEVRQSREASRSATLRDARHKRAPRHAMRCAAARRDPSVRCAPATQDTQRTSPSKPCKRSCCSSPRDGQRVEDATSMQAICIVLLLFFCIVLLLLLE